MPVTQGLSDYGAPEQLQGKPDVDSRADTFAFVLYEMLTGKGQGARLRSRVKMRRV